MERARRICEPENLTSELEHLNNALQADEYIRNQLNTNLYPKVSQKDQKKKEGTSKIGRLLTKYNLKSL